jgi:two-component sensor histidine kinase
MITLAPGELDQQILIREFHHRIANELQVMMTALARCRKVPDRAEMLPMLVDLEERMLAFTALNRVLALPAVVRPFADHCGEICSLLTKAFGRADVATELEIEDVALCGSDRLYLLLMVVELVINAMKHGRAGSRPELIRVTFEMHSGQASLTVANRSSDAADCPARPPRVVAAMARHMGGTVSVTRTAWHRVNVSVPIQALPKINPHADPKPDTKFAVGDGIRAHHLRNGKARASVSHSWLSPSISEAG